MSYEEFKVESIQKPTGADTETCFPIASLLPSISCLMGMYRDWLLCLLVLAMTFG
jgi:hypothetical protein